MKCLTVDHPVNLSSKYYFWHHYFLKNSLLNKGPNLKGEEKNVGLFFLKLLDINIVSLYTSQMNSTFIRVWFTTLLN